MPTFERTKTHCPTSLAARNLSLARKRYLRAKDAELKGADFYCEVLGLQYKHEPSARAAIVYTVLENGLGRYNVEDIAAACEVENKIVVTAMRNFLIPRAFECAPFCDRQFALEEGQIVASAVPGAKEAVRAYLAMSDSELARAARCLPDKERKVAKVVKPAVAETEPTAEAA